RGCLHRGRLTARVLAPCRVHGRPVASRRTFVPVKHGRTGPTRQYVGGPVRWCVEPVRTPPARPPGPHRPHVVVPGPRPRSVGPHRRSVPAELGHVCPHPWHPTRWHAHSGRWRSPPRPPRRCL